MDTKKLSLRLEKAASYVQLGARLADIGSDHAYLPCALAAAGRIESAIAGEIIEGPFQIATKQVERLGLQKMVTVRLGDGLTIIDPESDQLTAITICGMGGALIASILEEGKQLEKLTGKERLILQPNKDEAELRTWLVKHGYQMMHEALLEESGKLYEIMVAEKANFLPVVATEADIAFGFHLRKEKSPLFIKKWQNELAKNTQILADLSKSATEQSAKMNCFKARIDNIEELLR
ncbi:MAG: tRNA (adenine(22)-N(1))-methyltransferase TrmK [Carnobacterium sp.]|uniref:tRNA (adenine(22)-N(1))-methyltransferase n=1 Tax=Carnobacterium sp. TaxID=48221 RepID=UPI002FC70292